jgi:hypothetical protein
VRRRPIALLTLPLAEPPRVSPTPHRHTTPVTGLEGDKREVQVHSGTDPPFQKTSCWVKVE